MEQAAVPDRDTFWDDFEADPELVAAVSQARELVSRLFEIACHWGNCVVWVDPYDNTTQGGFGPVDCPCEHLPGRHARHLEGTGRPAVPALPRGRHGSRVQRSRRRHHLPPGIPGILEWVPASSRAPRT